MDSQTLESRFILIALIGLLAVVFLMIKPYLAILLLAIVLAVVFEPLQIKLAKQLRSPSLAALLTTLIVLALVLLPLLLFGYQLVQESANLYGYLAQRSDGNGFAHVLERIQQLIATYIPGFELETGDIIRFVQDSLGALLANVGFVFAGFARLVVGFLLMLLVFYYLVRDGRKLKERLIRLSPLSDTHEKEIIKTLEQAVHGVVRGELIIALIQGLVAGIGFTLFGVPNPALWAGLLILASFVPTIGTALVQAPIIAYVYLTGELSAALGLTAWAVLAVGLVDNWLRPVLVSKGTGLHPLIMLFSVLGGIVVFGPIGVLIGPIVVALTIALLHIWLRVITDAKEHSHRKIKITS